MLKFNNEHIITGYIKQLLASFHLPKYRIYTKKDAEYKAQNGKEPISIIVSDKRKTGDANVSASYNGLNRISYVNYIKNDQIQRFTGSGWENTNKHYHYNVLDLNHTKNLIIKSNVYDSYTHEYLGEYLRFVRDYHNIDLMPLYNCFSNKICSSLNLTFGKTDTKKVFDSDDNDYKIYMLPVKLFNTYTIAIDSQQPVEICCGFYDAYLDTKESLQDIYSLTYQKFNSLSFNSPVIYNKISAENIEQSINSGTSEEAKAELNSKLREFAQNETMLKMFIKIPASNTSTITILEGNYLNFNDGVMKVKDNRLQRNINHFVTNYAEGTNETGFVYPAVEDRAFIPYTKLQLLEANTGVSHPFADRLIEYLTGNAVVPTDEIADNFNRIQEVMGINKITFPADSLWYNEMRNILYDYMNDPEYNHSSNILIDKNHDCLGYLDKDVEALYTGWKKEDSKYKPVNTISGVDLYTNIYPGGKK